MQKMTSTRLNQLNNQIEAIRNKGKINIFDLMSLQKYKQEAENFKNVFRHTMKAVHTGINVP